MTFRELYEKMIDRYADEKGIVRGKPVMLLYRISRAAEAVGFDTPADASFEDMINDAN